MFFKEAQAKAWTDVPEVEATGSLMLGGFDTSKMSGPSIEFGIVSPKKMARLGAPLTSISANVNGESTVVWNVTSDDTIRKTYIPAVLDSGASRTEIPILAHRDLIKHLNRSFKGGLFAKREKGSPWLGDMDCGHRSVNVTGKSYWHFPRLAVLRLDLGHGSFGMSCFTLTIALSTYSRFHLRGR